MNDEWRPGLCVGIDPDGWGREHAFDLVFATRHVARAYKLNYWAFATQDHIHATVALAAVVNHIKRHTPGIPVILDAMFGDVAHITQRQAEWTTRLQFDAVTISSHNTVGTYDIFWRHGIFCFYANTDLGDLAVRNVPIEFGQVLPATVPDAINIAHKFRTRNRYVWVLSPGYGKQGGSTAVVSHGLVERYFANVGRAISEADNMEEAANYWADQLNPK
jgi:orotidine-5'-phosphate decarboxylase